jgi:hypothetical protein
MNSTAISTTEVDTFTSHWLHKLTLLLPFAVACLAVVLLVWITVFALRRLLALRHLLSQRWVFLELTPPGRTDKSSEANERLLSELHGLNASRSWIDVVMDWGEVLSLELTATSDQGIRYVVRVAQENVMIFEQAMVSYLPDIRYKRVEDYLSKLQGRKVHVIEFRQTGHFAYPLLAQESLLQHDPVTYVTGTMTKLSPGEMISLQIVATPTNIPEANHIEGRILGNEELLHSMGRRKTSGMSGVFTVINSILFGILDLIGETVHTTSPGSNNGYSHDAQRQREVAMKIRPARALSAFETQLGESVHNKVLQPLYRVNIRALVAVDDKPGEKARVKGMKASMSAFGIPKYQSIKARIDWPLSIARKYRAYMFNHRLPSFFKRNQMILSCAELAGIYHFPANQNDKTENVVQSLSRTLPAPVSLKGDTKLDVVLGRNHHHGSNTDIGLTREERERHVFIIGGTGNGKTTMMEYAIVQDIRAGKGVAVIDPHGDMAERLLRFIPEERVGDVIYFNPDDLDYPMGLNLLEIPEGLKGNDVLRAKDFIAEQIVSLMRKIFSDDDSGGHRIEYVLRNTVHTAFTIKDATIFTVLELLTNAKLRSDAVKSLTDPYLKNFWVEEMGEAGDMQRIKMSAGVTNKIGRFKTAEWTNRVMSQPKSTIDFDDILDGKILICNFAKGNIGEDTSELFGIATLMKLQLAAYRRVKKPIAERKPFYIYVDEFQNFATTSFVQLLSEARKYKVFLTMAEQSVSQQDDKRMVNTILANVGTVVCFRSGGPEDEKFMLPLFEPYIKQGEISYLPSYSFYARIPSKVPQEPMSGETLVLTENGSSETAEAVKKASRANYTKEYTETKEDAVVVEIKGDDKAGSKEKPKAKPKPKKAGRPKTQLNFDVE